MEYRTLERLLFSRPAYNIVGHVRPDGDCVGSQLALYHILMARNIVCNVIKNDDYGHILSPFFSDCTLVSCENFDSTLPLICVDCSSYERVGDKITRRCPRPYINIDHHISNNNFAEHNFINACASSTAQVIGMELIDGGIDFDRTVAEMLYLGIMTDSGRFAYDTVSLDTIKIVEILMGKGVSLSDLYKKIYERDSLAKYRLLGRCLGNISVFADGRCCTTFVEEKDFLETGAELLDTEGFVNYARQVDGVQVGAFLEFHSAYVKCSLRSSSPSFRMDLLAKHFGGGGHPAAAGFTASSPNGDFYAKFKGVLTAHVGQF
jgi:phosphoesterase RecJ-like protein